MLPPIPECGRCPYAAWPATCSHAAEGVRRKCELVAMGRADYRAGLDREMTGVPTPEPIPAEGAPAPARCCGQPDTAAFFGVTIEPIP